jgi:hypothetical protein
MTPGAMSGPPPVRLIERFFHRLALNEIFCQ